MITLYLFLVTPHHTQTAFSSSGPSSVGCLLNTYSPANYVAQSITRGAGFILRSPSSLHISTLISLQLE